MALEIQIPAHIAALKEYQGGMPIAELAREKKLERIVKLASNENPLGASPKALQALANMSADTNRYVDPHSWELTHALAGRLGLTPERIICGAGTDSLLANIVLAFSEKGDEVLTASGTFIGILVNTRKYNRRLVTVPLNDYRFDLNALAGAITEKTRIIYIANPNNPTGTFVTGDEFGDFLEQVPKNILVALDEAYFNYSKNITGYPDGLTFDAPNLIVTRTFSKDYGLAGLRIGFAVSDEEIIKTLYKVRLPFEPSSAAQIAALAALDDDQFLAQTVAQNERSLKIMSDRLCRIGIHVIESVANFVQMIFESESFACEFTAACLERGLILRHTTAFGVPEGVRMNSGTDQETEFALDIIEAVYHQLSDTPASRNCTSFIP